MIGRAPIRPPNGCRFIQSVPDLMIEYPLEHSADVVQWFREWTNELEFHVRHESQKVRQSSSAVVLGYLTGGGDARIAAEAARIASNNALLAAALQKQNGSRLPSGGTLPLPSSSPTAGGAGAGVCGICEHSVSRHNEDGKCTLTTCICEKCEPVFFENGSEQFEPPPPHPNYDSSYPPPGSPPIDPTLIAGLANGNRSFGPGTGVVPIGTPIPGFHWESGVMVRDSKPAPAPSVARAPVPPPVPPPVGANGGNG